KYTLLIRVLSAHGRFAEAKEKVWPEMQKRGVQADMKTYTALLAGAGLARDGDAAEEV
ncbi:unnamed protein product, partial [Choristocarpus tenellus]